jgi:hypothetical protein
LEYNVSDQELKGRSATPNSLVLRRGTIQQSFARKRRKETILMEGRFTALRVIGTIFKILAWLALVVGLLAAIALLVGGFLLGDSEGLLGFEMEGPLVGIAGFVVILIVSIIYFLLLYAVGESIYLFLSIEESSRRSAYFVQQLYASQQPVYPPPTTPDYGD